MALTPAQLPVLKAAILAETDSAFVEYRNNGDNGQMAAWFNEPFVPTFYVWRADYTSDQIAAAIDNGITQLDALTASKRDSLLWWAGRSHDMRKASVQAAVNDLCGSQNTLKSAVLDGGKRGLLKVERLFATGTGSLAAPGSTSFDGQITSADITDARNLP